MAFWSIKMLQKQNNGKSDLNKSTNNQKMNLNYDED